MKLFLLELEKKLMYDKDFFIISAKMFCLYHKYAIFVLTYAMFVINFPIFSSSGRINFVSGLNIML